MKWRRRVSQVPAQGALRPEPFVGGPSGTAERGAGVETTEGADGASSEHRALLDIVGLVVAPASLLTGLGIYFGFLHTHAFYRYLNIDASVLQFSTTDYLIRSVNGFLVPMAILASVSLIFILFHAGLKAALSSSRQRWKYVRHVPRIVVVLGSLLVVNALFALTEGSGVIFPIYLAAPASMCAGVFLILSGLRLADTGKRALPALSSYGYSVMAIAGLLLLVGALWGTAQYADSTGTREARTLVRYLDLRPAVVVHSREPLGIALDEKINSSMENGLSYRYTGARLVLQSGGKYLLLTDGWSRDDGWTILLNDESGIRLDFSAHHRS